MIAFRNRVNRYVHHSVKAVAVYILSFVRSFTISKFNLDAINVLNAKKMSLPVLTERSFSKWCHSQSTALTTVWRQHGSSATEYVWEWIQGKRHFMLNISECSLKGAICNLAPAKYGVISGKVLVIVTRHKLWQNCCLQYKRFWVTVWCYKKVCGVDQGLLVSMKTSEDKQKQKKQELHMNVSWCCSTALENRVCVLTGSICPVHLLITVYW